MEEYHLCDDSILYGSTYRKVERPLLTYARLSNQQMSDASVSINIKKVHSLSFFIKFTESDDVSWL